MVDIDRTPPGGRHRWTSAVARPQILTYTVLMQHMVYRSSQALEFETYWIHNTSPPVTQRKREKNVALIVEKIMVTIPVSPAYLYSAAVSPHQELSTLALLWRLHFTQLGLYF